MATLLALGVFYSLRPETSAPLWILVPFVLAGPGVAVTWGLLVRSRRQLIASLRERATMAEVEARLLAHDAVAQAVVVAALDLDGLEKPVAYVQLHPQRTATEDELVEFCRAGLPSFKRPRRVVFVDTYPTTATGKIRRVDLRARAASVLLTPPVPSVPDATAPMGTVRA